MRFFYTKCPYCQSDIRLTNEWIGMTCQCPVCSKDFPVRKPAVLKKLKKVNKCNTAFSVQIYTDTQPIRWKFVVGIVCLILSLPLLATFAYWIKCEVDINAEARELRKEGDCDMYYMQYIKDQKKKNTFSNAWSKVMGAWFK